MKKSILAVIGIGLTAVLFSACGAKKEGVENKTESTTLNTGTINSSADEVADRKFPAITFKDTVYHFDTIVEGESINMEYSFANTGEAPLLVSNASATCGCTVPKISKEPIAPGDSGKIEVVFNSAHKKGLQNKIVTVHSNIKENTSFVSFDVFVKPNPDKK